MGASTLTLQDIVKKSTDLPALPAAALAAMREADSPTGSARTVAMHISRDQSLSGRVLRLANSAYYGLERQVTDIQEGVVVLGMRTVRNLAVIAASYPWMVRPLTGYMLEPKAMWLHSFGVAVGAQLIAKKSGKCDPELAFTAGLLHNIGKVALNVWLDKKLSAMLSFAVKDDIPFDAVERKLLGYDHGEVGAYIAEVWNLPDSLIEPMRFHHRPNECNPSNPVVDCIHVADFLTMSLGLGLGGDGLRYDFESDSMTRLGLTDMELDYLTSDFVEAYEAYAKVMEEMESV